MVMNMFILCLSFMLSYQLCMVAQAKDAVAIVPELSKEVDANHEGMHMGHEQQAPAVAHDAHAHDAQSEKVESNDPQIIKEEKIVPSSSEAETKDAVIEPIQVPAQKENKQVSAVKDVESTQVKTEKIEKSKDEDVQTIDIEKAKQQIKAAELEIARLKQLLIAAEAAPSVEDVLKVIELNKKLIAVFDKQIRDYRAQGVSYFDDRIKQLQNNIRSSEQELVAYEKQLKKSKKFESEDAFQITKKISKPNE